MQFLRRQSGSLMREHLRRPERVTHQRRRRQIQRAQAKPGRIADSGA